MSEKEEQSVISPRSDKVINESVRSDNKASQGDSKKKRQNKEFYQEELNRLKKSLKKESEKIVPPQIKEHFPYVFNKLTPYFSVSNAKDLIESQEAQQRYTCRPMAHGLCEPWVDHQLDMPKCLPTVESSHAVINTKNTKLGYIQQQQDRPPKEGSTRLPKFPTVHMPQDEFLRKPLYYNDVAALRNELKKKYHHTATEKVKNDYRRTKEDFFRMELDRMDSYHPTSRPKMKSVYYAYLQNTLGSKKAVTECVESIEKQAKSSKHLQQPAN